MTTKKKAGTGKGEAKKLKVKKETLRDLNVKKSRDVKGGVSGGYTACAAYTWCCQAR